MYNLPICIMNLQKVYFFFDNKFFLLGIYDKQTIQSNTDSISTGKSEDYYNSSSKDSDVSDSSPTSANEQDMKDESSYLEEINNNKW